MFASARFNFRPLLVLVGFLAVVALATHFVHRVQTRRLAEHWLQVAHQAHVAGTPDDETVALKRYLQLAPNDLDALERYSVLLEEKASRRRDSWQVVSLLEQLLEEDPTRQDARRRLAHLLIRLRDYREAARHLAGLAKARPDAATYDLLGQCQEALRDYGTAMASYRKSIEGEPQRVGAHVRLARVLRSLSQASKADAVMDEMVLTCKDSPLAWRERARYRQALGELEGAAEDLEQAARLDPGNLAILLAQAATAEQRGELEEASKLRTRAIEKLPTAPGLYRELALTETHLGRLGSAARILERGLEKDPANPSLLLLLAEIRLEQNDPAAARLLAERLPEDAASAADLRAFLLARLDMAEGRWGAASEQLTGLLRSPDLPAWLAGEAGVALGDCQGRLGNEDRQLAAYQEAVWKAPALARARLALASAQLRRGAVEQALEECRILRGQEAPPPALWLTQARALIQQNLHYPPATRNWLEVEAALDRAARYPSLRGEEALLRAEVLLAQEQAEAAAEVLELAQAQLPGDAALWQARIRLALLQGKAALADQLRRQAQEDLDGSLEVLLTHAEELLLRRPAEVMPVLRELERELERRDGDDRARLLALLARAYHRLGHLFLGNRFCRRLAGLEPVSLPRLTLALGLAIEGKDDLLVEELASRLRQLEGAEGTWWRYAEASKLLLRPQALTPEQLVQARKGAEEILARRPGWKPALLLRAQVLDRQNDPETVGAYLRAFEEGERGSGMVIRLLRLLVDRGRDFEADRVLRELGENQLQGELAQVAAELALRLGQSQRALALARRAMPASPPTFAQCLWLGRVLGQGGDNEEAERVLRRATQLEPGLAAPWVALIGQQTRMGLHAEASRTWELMQEAVLPTLRPVARAQGLEALARMEDARAAFERAVADQPSSLAVLVPAIQLYLRMDLPQLAMPLLRRILAPETALPVSYQGWARRQLALLLAADGSGEGRREALALLEANRVGKAEQAADHRARLLVEASHPDRRGPALRELEKGSVLRTLSAEEMFRLARLYEQAGSWPHAREHYARAVATDTTNPVYLARFIEALLERGRYTEARFWLGKLERLEPDSRRTRRLKQLAAE